MTEKKGECSAIPGEVLSVTRIDVESLPDEIKNAIVHAAIAVGFLVQNGDVVAIEGAETCVDEDLDKLSAALDLVLNISEKSPSILMH